MKPLSSWKFSKSSKPTKHYPPPLPQVLPACKRKRTNRPHPHRPPYAPEPDAPVIHFKVEDNTSSFPDFFDTEGFLIDHSQEVPSPVTDLPASPGSSYEYSPLDSRRSATCFSSESFHGGASPEDSPLADPIQCRSVVLQDEHAVADELGLLPVGIDTICFDADGNISLAGDSCFISGDIPGLKACDDCSLSVDLELRGAPVAFEGDHTGTLASKSVVEADHFASGPFAKYFVTKSKSKLTSSSWSPEIIKSEAREILRCCTEGERSPTLRLNYEEIIAAWSDRGEPWVLPECCNIITTMVMGLPAGPMGVLVC